MSNFIPMVSASPPPFDDHSFGYDDEDDFGTFTGADDSHESSPGPPEPTSFEPDLEISEENNKNNNPEGNNLTAANINDNANKLHPQEITKTEAFMNGTEESDDFANFEQYDSNQKIDNIAKKPHIENLPIQSVGDNSTESSGGQLHKNVNESKGVDGTTGASPDNGSCDFKSPTCDKDTVQSTVTGSRDSTTDSGMFSTDISPVPKSEDTAELCDRSCDSDNDDTFPDLPKDKTEPTDSLPVSEIEDFQLSVDSPDIESDTRTNSVLESCSNVDECVSEASKEESSSVSQTKVEEGDTALNKDDQSVSCSSTDQQVSPLNSRDDSQLLSEQNEKSSQDVSSGHVENIGEDEDDWGDFDSAGSAVGDGSDKDVNPDVTGKLPVDIQDDFVVCSEANHAYAETQSEDECLEAIDDALKDSENVGVTDLDVTDQLDLEVLGETEVTEDKSKDDSIPNVDEISDSSEKVPEIDEDSCDMLPEGDIVSDSFTESNHGNECAKETTDQPQDSQEDKSGDFVADNEEWNAFGDFSESGGDSGDNWADFQDFQAPSSETREDASTDVSRKTPIDDNEEDAEFGDFNSAKQQSVTENVTVSSGDVAFVTDKDNEDDEGDWADFEESSSAPLQTSTIPARSTRSVSFSTESDSHSKVPKEKLEKILSTCFPSSDSRDAVHSLPSQLEVLISAQPQQGKLSMHISPKIRGPGVVWGSLQNLDKTNALVYQWSTSAANTRMFKTLHIDTQNILFGHKKQSVPIFASNIGLLEPIRGSVDAKPLQPKPNPTLVDPDKADDHTGGSQELPPVEFDWDNSGLTNPLTVAGSEKPSPVYAETPGPVINSSISKTLDLDFLCVQETENVNKNTVFQSEILDAPRSSVKSLPPLEDVLKNMKTTTTTRRRQDEHLSEEAGRIIDSLPLLSFMTSKVLMFPLRQANE